MRIYDVISYLENKFPISSQASFDNCGVQVGDVFNELKGVLIIVLALFQNTQTQKEGQSSLFRVKDRS